MDDLLPILDHLDQPHLIEALVRLEGPAHARLEAQVRGLDWAAIQAGLAPRSPVSVDQAEPYPWIDRQARQGRDAQALEAGWGALRAGKVAALLMAGGSGTRLGWSGPKGTFPALPALDLSLYEIHARKVRRVGQHAGTPAPFAVMLSDETSAPTRAFFAAHGRFGIAPVDLLLFEQGTLPAVDDQGRVLMAGPDRLTAFPDGHGGIYRALLHSGTLDALEARGVEHVFVFQVDNPLAPVLDPAFVGYHVQEGSSLSFLSMRKNAPEEKVAVFARQPDGTPVIVEYISLPERFTREWQRFAAGNPAIYVFRLDFMRRMAQADALTPHRSRKKVPYWTDDRGEVAPEQPNAWRLEKLLFDALPRAPRHLVLEDEREATFAPIKNASGVDSAESAWLLMRQRALALLAQAGYPADQVPDTRPVEMAPELLCDPQALRAAVAAGQIPPPMSEGPLLVLA